MRYDGSTAGHWFSGASAFQGALAGLGVLLPALAASLLPGAAADEPAGSVSVRDTGSQIGPASYECTFGHKVDTHLITLDSGAVRYTFRYSGCTDASHGDLRPSAEGNFGMPEPTSGNWYWGGFLRVLINGKDAIGYRQTDMRAIETGARGAFQAIWAHPDADVGARFLMLPGGNHVLAYLTWRPKPGAKIDSVLVNLRCYPSFFTAPHHRQGERHCQTPRANEREPKTLELVPAKDPYLYYYDAVFDVAKGEGDGPCAALVNPQGVKAGRVHIGDYAVSTDLEYPPEAGQARLAFYDFTGKTNAEAEAYLKAHWAEDLAQLVQTDFRPEPVRLLQADRLQSEATKLLADAADDGKALQPKVNELLSRVAALRAKAGQGDWQAEADLATALQDSADLFWRLRAFALLNGP